MSNFLWICSKRTKTCDFPVWIWSYIFGSLSRSLATNNWILQTAPVPPRDGRHIHDLTWTDLMPSTSHTKNWSELIQAKTGRVGFLYIDSESSVFTKKLFVCLGDIQTKTLQGWTWFFWCWMLDWWESEGLCCCPSGHLGDDMYTYITYNIVYICKYI